jgi:hypothetical protein
MTLQENMLLQQKEKLTWYSYTGKPKSSATRLKARFQQRTNVTYKFKSTLHLQIGSLFLLHFSANIWYFGASRTVRHVQYVTFECKWKRTLSQSLH